MVTMPDYTLEGEEWQASPEGWPQAPTYSGWGGSRRRRVLRP